MEFCCTASVARFRREEPSSSSTFPRSSAERTVAPARPRVLKVRLPARIRLISSSHFPFSNLKVFPVILVKAGFQVTSVITIFFLILVPGTALLGELVQSQTVALTRFLLPLIGL